MNPKADILYTADLHGSRELYPETLLLARKLEARAIVIGGDLAPHATVGEQAAFFREFMIPLLREYREEPGAADIFYVLGNDDWSANLKALTGSGIQGFHHVHGVVRPLLGGAWIAGLASVGLTPFALKDWERWDDGAAPAGRARLSGVTSRGGAITPCDFDPERRAPTIGDALDDLARTAGEPAGTIFVCHTPPSDTRCDMIGAASHVGSRALRAFTERHQPPLVLSGHIHESARVSGAWRDAIGRTVVVNPGQFGGSRLCGVWFDPADPAATLRHTVHA